MKRIFYSTLLLLLIPSVSFISSCKKSTPVDGKVATITIGSNVYTFSYDGQGRLTTFTSASGSSSLVYSPSSVTITTGGNSTVVPLNNQGYATSAGGDVYSYDNNGYLLSDVYNGTTTTNYSFNGGNLTSVISNNVTTDAYSYLNTTDYRDYGLHFIGKSGSDINFAPKSANLVNTDQSGAVTYQYSYTFDAKGRVQTQTVTGNGGSSTSVYSYVSN